MKSKRREFEMILKFAVLFITLAFVSVGCASAATIYVPDNYLMIQAAVNVADPGDIVIVRDGTYAENVNVNKRLTIQSENGSDSTVVQAGSDNGFYVTADYVHISGFTVECGSYKSGFDLHSADHCNISNNNVSNNYAAKGVYLVQSSSNILTSNNISNNWRGICLSSSSNNQITINNLNSNYGDNIWMSSSSNNILTNNNVSDSNMGINVHSSNNNILTNNNVSNNNYGIRMTFSSNSNIMDNTVKSNTEGIWLGYSSNNTLTNNMLTGNDYNFGVNGDSPSEYVHDIDMSNKVNGKPIYYLVNRQDMQIPNDAGFVGIVNSTNMTVRDLTLTDNYEGVLFANTNNSRIENVTVSNSRYGIYLSYSSNNTVTNGTANSNSWHGISLHFSPNNAIYLNNFLDNNQNAYSEDSTNIWNSTEEITYTYSGSTHTSYLGNYWSDYTEIDTDTNGIGDTAYSIDGDKDIYPLMWHWENYFTPPEKQPPTALFTYAPTYPLVNQPITFDASSSYDPEGFITNYEWDFRDGNTTNTTEKIVTHSYTLEGDYNVNLTVTDNDGVINTTSKVVRVLKSTLHEDEWNQTFGGTDREWAHSVQQTTDGGYILVGETDSYGSGRSDFWLVKTDSNGTEQWNQTFGGTGRDMAQSVQQTADGGYILAGLTESYSAGGSDFWLVKTDSDGNMQWDRTFGSSSWDIAKSVQQTTDGGYILAGHTCSYGAGSADFWLVKTDSNGSAQWNKTFGGTDHDFGRAVRQTADGGYILTGDTRSYGAGWSDFWLVKTDSIGNEQWNQTFGGTDFDEAYSVQQTADGGYILAGNTWSYGVGYYDAWLVKTDSNGNKQWDKTFGGTGPDNAYSVQQTADGGYILAGDVGAIWLVKTDSNGNMQWDKTFGGDCAYSVQQTSDGGYILAGTIYSYGAGGFNFRLIKVEREGPTPTAFFTHTPRYPGVNQTIVFDASLSYDPDGNITNYEWDFGDEGIINTAEKIITHSYALEGGYNVNLTVTDNDGLMNSISKAVKVLMSPQPEEKWNHTFGSANTDDRAWSVQQTTDGGYILAGYTEPYGGSADFWLVKTDSNGNEQWNQTFGGTSTDMAKSVQQTADDGYILAGRTMSYGAGSYDAWLVKTDSDGKEQWNQTFGDTGYDYANSVQQTTDDGYILAGSTSSYGAGSVDFWLVKTDSNGSEQWNKTFGGTDEDRAHTLQQTADGGYILAGDVGYYDVWLVKAGSNGNEQWNQTFGGTGSNHAYSVQQTTDNGYILAGETYSYGAGNDFWLVKTDSNGNEQWSQTLGGANDDRAYSVRQTADGGYILAGYSNSYGAGKGDFWLVKTDSNGTMQWDETFGGTGYDRTNSVQQTADGGYILAGYTESYGAGAFDFWLIKVSDVTQICGDLNHDGKVTPADAVIALRLAVSGEWNADADVSGDGRITSLDALMILRAAIGAISL